MRRRRSPEIIAGQWSNGLTICTDDRVMVTNTGTGTYSFQWPPNFRPVSLSIVGLNDQLEVAYWNPANNTMTLRVANTAVITTMNFAFTAVGVQQ